MISTAQVLLFIALSMNPHDATQILATSNSDNYLWSHEGSNWQLQTKGLPTDDWAGKDTRPISAENRELRRIARHHWKDGASLDLANGNRIEERNGAAFYIVRPGAPSQKVFTILYYRD